MSLYLQGDIWWYESGWRKRFRSSTRTTDKGVAQRVEAEHRESLKRSGVKVSATLHAIKVEEAARRRARIWEGVETQKDPPETETGRSRGWYGVTPETCLQEAGELFLAKQRERCRPKTIECNEGYVRRLVEPETSAYPVHHRAFRALPEYPRF